jgi:hypothetical protein
VQRKRAGGDEGQGEKGVAWTHDLPWRTG